MLYKTDEMFQVVDGFIDSCLIVNGLYDILCAICILYFPARALGRLHLSCFPSNGRFRSFERMLAYWIMTYGLVRAISGLHSSRVGDLLAITSYFMEAWGYFNESEVVGFAHPNQARFVYTACLFIACVVAIFL